MKKAIIGTFFKTKKKAEAYQLKKDGALQRKAFDILKLKDGFLVVNKRQLV